MKYQDALVQIADKLSLPLEVVKYAYESYWEYIRIKITELPFKEELSEDEFKNLRTNFNIPSIGKLSCTYPRYKAIKDRYKHLKSLRNGDNKES